jgi:hypothetical protein
MSALYCPDCGERLLYLEHACPPGERRDAFAAAALTACIGDATYEGAGCAQIAAACYDYADAMIAERRRRLEAAASHGKGEALDQLARFTNLARRTQRLMSMVYPPDVFTGESGDPGALAARAVNDALEACGYPAERP